MFMKTKYILLLGALGLSACMNRELDRSIVGCYHVGLDANNQVVLTNCKGSLVIGGEIIKIEYDEDFIIALQIPADKIRQEVASKGGNLDDERRAVRESKERNYWIIDLADDDRYICLPKKVADSLRENLDVHGPLSKERYDSLRNALNVPCELQFESRQNMKESGIYFNF